MTLEAPLAGGLLEIFPIRSDFDAENASRPLIGKQISFTSVELGDKKAAGRYSGSPGRKKTRAETDAGE